MFKNVTEIVEDVQGALSHASEIIEDALNALQAEDYEEAERTLRLLQRYLAK